MGGAPAPPLLPQSCPRRCSRGVRPATAAEQRPPAAAPAAPVEEGEQQDEQLKVEQQQEQQGGVQVEQQVGEGASIAQHEAELQVER